jgi:hypothetical protein
VVYVGLSYRFGGTSSSSDKEEGGWAARVPAVQAVRHRAASARRQAA